MKKQEFFTGNIAEELLTARYKSVRMHSKNKIVIIGGHAVSFRYGGNKEGCEKLKSFVERAMPLTIDEI